MLSDFINVNKLKSKLIQSNKSITSLTQIIELSGLEKNCVFKSITVMDELSNVWIIVFPWIKRLNEEKIKELIPDFSYFLEGDELLEATGYAEGLIPPISVYDAKILIDSSFKHKEKITGIVESEELLLILELIELKEFNHEIIFAKITK
jgi:prolyl-tRNA editing enzyme YbaK/EbsC (Cys-tRNA(Pro) deacylase)